MTAIVVAPNLYKPETNNPLESMATTQRSVAFLYNMLNIHRRNRAGTVEDHTEEEQGESVIKPSPSTSSDVEELDDAEFIYTNKE